MGLFEKIGHAVSRAAVSAGSDVVHSAALRKAEMELSELVNRYDDCYIIIGKRIAEYLRNGETIEDPKVQQAFERIKKLDLERAEKEKRHSRLERGFDGGQRSRGTGGPGGRGRA